MRRVAFISHQLFSQGDYEENCRDIEAIAIYLYHLGLAPIMPQHIAPFTIYEGKEIDRQGGIECCNAILPKCDIIVFDIEKISDGVRHELNLAQSMDIPIYEIHYIKTMYKGGGYNEPICL